MSFLSQSEVDALLRGVASETDDEDDLAGSDPKPYNFHRGERIVRGRMPGLELTMERFARELRLAWFKAFQSQPEVSVGPVRVQKNSEFIRNLVVPTCLNIVEYAPLGVGLLVFDPNLVFLVVDRVFGGDGRFHTRVEGRDFTPTERSVIASMAEATLASLASSWAKHLGRIEPKVVGMEHNSQFAVVAEPSEIVVSVTFTLELGGCSADLHWLLPYRCLASIRDALDSSSGGFAEGKIPVVPPQALFSIPATVELRVAEFALPLAEAARLAKGSRIAVSLDPDATVPAFGVVRGSPAFACLWSPNDPDSATYAVSGGEPGPVRRPLSFVHIPPKSAPAPASAREALGSLAALPVQASIAAGSWTASLADIAALRPGYPLTFDREDGFYTLLAGGKPKARLSRAKTAPPGFCGFRVEEILR